MSGSIAESRQPGVGIIGVGKGMKGVAKMPDLGHFKFGEDDMGIGCREEENDDRTLAEVEMETGEVGEAGTGIEEDGVQVGGLEKGLEFILAHWRKGDRG
jgi:hypothetical protein